MEVKEGELKTITNAVNYLKRVYQQQRIDLEQALTSYKIENSLLKQELLNLKGRTDIPGIQIHQDMVYLNTELSQYDLPEEVLQTIKKYVSDKTMASKHRRKLAPNYYLRSKQRPEVISESPKMVER